jgi:hypothetical protein
MAAEMCLRGDGGDLRISIGIRENPSPQNLDDANWLRGTVAVAVGEFSADYTAAFMSQDFGDFQAQLETLVSAGKGSASFRTLEDALEIDIEVGGLGQAYVRGVARVVGPPSADLSFSFESDLGRIAAASSALKRVISDFPVIRQLG